MYFFGNMCAEKELLINFADKERFKCDVKSDHSLIND